MKPQVFDKIFHVPEIVLDEDQTPVIEDVVFCFQVLIKSNQPAIIQFFKDLFAVSATPICGIYINAVGVDV